MKIVLYHGNCADGFGAAWVIRNHFAEGNIGYFPLNYGEDYSYLNEIVAGNDVYCVDFSFKREIIAQLWRLAKSFVVLDHHKTAAAECEGLDYCYFDMSKSGMMLAWEYFIPDADVPALVRYVQDRDLWAWALPDSKEISASLGSYERTFELYDRFANGLEDDFARLKIIDEGRTILRIQEGAVEAAIAVERVREMEIGGHKVPVINCTSLISETIGRLAIGKPFAAGFFWNGNWVFSLRSSVDGLDVSEIARAYGGGGHKHAAGFTLTSFDAISDSKIHGEAQVTGDGHVEIRIHDVSSQVQPR